MLFFFKSSIKSHVGYDVIGNNKPWKKARILKVPALFMKGEVDEMINDEIFSKMVG